MFPWSQNLCLSHLQGTVSLNGPHRLLFKNTVSSIHVSRIMKEILSGFLSAALDRSLHLSQKKLLTNVSLSMNPSGAVRSLREWWCRTVTVTVTLCCKMPNLPWKPPWCSISCHQSGLQLLRDCVMSRPRQVHWQLSVRGESAAVNRWLGGEAGPACRRI